jgi:hypothetical protein
MRYYKNGNITTSPTITDVIAPSHETILANGWFVYIDNPPSYDNKKEKIVNKGVIDGVVQYEIVALTPEEIRAITVPHSITPAQCRVMLASLELLDTVESLIATVPLASIWWEYALEIRRDNQYVEMIGQALGWDTEQIDDFFIDASQIQ